MLEGRYWKEKKKIYIMRDGHRDLRAYMGRVQKLGGEREKLTADVWKDIRRGGRGRRMHEENGG